MRMRVAHVHAACRERYPMGRGTLGEATQVQRTLMTQMTQSLWPCQTRRALGSLSGREAMGGDGYVDE